MSLILTKQEIIDKLQEDICEVVFDTKDQTGICVSVTLKEEELPEMNDIEVALKQTSTYIFWDNEKQEHKDNDFHTGISVFEESTGFWIGICCSRITSIDGESVAYSAD
jgi:Ni,Fe-hydrogenase III component G